ncbi:hypothetical protein BEE12_16125 [Pantoea agglomerans]|uniref:immunoglobulin domain-containing protein n=1 Tax=Enterobacter agglomerans TaxID=549 RepID=UPI00083D3FAB|nr:immunoglobulin domain-containing protein [Pantoea agglomerans]AOE41244.1 hypothetical protein BEE12_16125 [Pantoea agglomerans]
MLDLNYPFFSKILNLVPARPIPPATAVQIGDLQAGKIGEIVPRPTVTVNGRYTSITWKSSDENILLVTSTPRGIKLVAPGKATITVELTDDSGKTLATATKEYTVTAPPDAPAVFTSQPAANVFYQDGGKLEITGAAAAPVTIWQWQKLQADGATWGDLPSQTAAVLTIPTATDADEGTYRVLAINGSADGVPSDPVTVLSTILYIQNDSAKPDLDAPVTDVNNKQFVMVDGSHYLMDGPAGNYYIGAYLKTKNGYTTKAGGKVDNVTYAPGEKVPPESFIIAADFGLTTSRAMGAKWKTTDASVIPDTPANANGGLAPVAIVAGKASVTCTWQNLTSTLTVDF